MNAAAQSLAPGAQAGVIAARPAVTAERFEFHGSGEEYFRIWIVNLALTLVTLGIYSAWAKVRRLRYFHGNTILAGSPFDYLGSPIAILKGRLLAVAVLAIGGFLAWQQPLLSILYFFVIGILTPVLVVRGRLFRMRMTSYRNIRFDFRKDYRGAYGAFFWWPLAVAFVGFIYPLARGAQYEYVISRTRFGQTPFSFAGTIGSFFPIYMLAGLLLVGTFLLFFFLGLGPLSDWLQESGWTERVPWLDAVPFLVAGALSWLVFQAHLSRSLLNASLGKTVIGTSKLHCDAGFLPLLAIYARNALFLVLTLGLYYPWARVAVERYKLQCLELRLEGTMDQFIAGQQSEVSAAGEELSEFLDVDIGL